MEFSSIRFWTASALIGFTLTIVGFSILRPPQSLDSRAPSRAASVATIPVARQPAEPSLPALSPLQQAVDLALEDEGLLGIAKSSSYREASDRVRQLRIERWAELHFRNRIESLSESDRNSLVSALCQSLENMIAEREFRSPKS